MIYRNNTILGPAWMLDCDRPGLGVYQMKSTIGKCMFCDNHKATIYTNNEGRHFIQCSKNKTADRCGTWMKPERSRK